VTGTIIVERRYHGPPDSAHGGYLSGLLAQHLGAGPAEVTLRRPPPLERPLRVQRQGNLVALLDGEVLVAEARPVAGDLDAGTVRTVSPAEAERASQGYLGFDAHIFADCLACGPDRAEGDGLRVFPGPVAGTDIVAAPWTPPSWTAEAGGLVRPEFVWAALDCPGAWALHGGEAGRPLILGRLAARLLRPVRAGDGYVVTAWPLGREGRKGFAGSTVRDAAGEVCALARATWFRIET
jgi:hypothetical protein